MARRRAPNKTPEEVYSETETEIQKAVERRTSYVKLGRGRRSLLKIPSLERSKHIKYLILAGTGISNLSGIEYLENLEYLNAADTNLSDISAIANLTKLSRLDFSRNYLRDISPLTNLNNLRHLNISLNDISDLSALSECLNIETLNIFGTKVQNLQPISSLKRMSELNINGTRISDLTPLSGLNLRLFYASRSLINSLDGLNSSLDIEVLNISHTKVGSLKGIGSLRSLKQISASSTQLSNIDLLSEAKSLKYADFEASSISDISAISELTMLERLDIDSTLVRDLAPLSKLTSLASAAKSGRGLVGIWMSDCDFDDKKLNELAELKNPDRTLKVLDYLRRTQGLPGISELEDLSVEVLPDLPIQGPGPRFGIDEHGLIGFSALEEIDDAGNNIGRIKALAPLLKDTIDDLLNEISSNEHPKLREIVLEYGDLLDPIVKGEPLNNLAIAQIYGLGLRLQNAAAAAERRIKQRFVPEYEDSVKEALDSALLLHGPFILSTVEGVELIDLTEKYHGDPDNEANLREASVELADALEAESSLIEADAAAFIKNSAEDSLESPENEKSLIYSSSLSKNITIVLAAGAAVSLLPAAGLAIGGMTGGVVGGVSAIVGLESLKKTKAFTNVTSKLTAGIDVSSNADVKNISEKTLEIFKPYLDFVIKNESLMRKLAGDRSRFRWLHLYLDWVRQKSKDD